MTAKEEQELVVAIKRECAREFEKAKNVKFTKEQERQLEDFFDRMNA